MIVKWSNDMEKKRVSRSNLQVKSEMFQALGRLLQEKALSAISVSDLTAEANVSRMAFYRNYNDIEDILTEHLREVVEQYREEDISVDGESGNYCSKEYMEHCFDFFYRHREFLSMLIQCGLGDLFLAEITEYLIEKWTSDGGEIVKTIEMSAFAGAIYNTYRFWQKKEFQQSPEQLARILTIERTGTSGV